MSDYKLVPFEPTPEMVSAAEDAYMPFGDMELALRMAILAAPAVQAEPVGEVCFEFGAPSAIYAELYSENLPSLAPGTKLYAAPQPAEQQPDVQGYVMVPAKEFESVLNRADWRTAKNRAELRHMLKALQSSAAPDVAQLVEALEASPHRLHDSIDGEDDCRCSQCKFVRLRDAALAAHRKGGGK